MNPLASLILACAVGLTMSQLSTHVLDTSRGKPAEAVKITLYTAVELGWVQVRDGLTDVDGRYSFSNNVDVQPGRYKLNFAIGNYFKKLNEETMYPFVEVAFEVKEDTKKLHIPLLVSAYGYSTYRGS